MKWLTPAITAGVVHLAESQSDMAASLSYTNEWRGPSVTRGQASFTAPAVWIAAATLTLALLVQIVGGAFWLARIESQIENVSLNINNEITVREKGEETAEKLNSTRFEALDMRLRRIEGIDSSELPNAAPLFGERTLDGINNG